MRASRFTRAFQLIAMVLVFTMVQVYVMAGPIKGNTDPNTSAGQPKAATVATDSSSNKIAATKATSENQLTTPEAAAEKTALRIGSKSALSRIFSKQDVAARIASENTFLKTSASLAGTFKTPAAQTSSTQTNNQSGDDDDKDRRSTWVAVGIIGAVLAIAVIGLRHDRNSH
jgi:hypothetical protein